MHRSYTQAHVSRRHSFQAVGIIASVLLFGYAVTSVSPQTLARTAHTMVASAVVGVAASVDPNPYNTAAVELLAKEEELRAREDAVRAFEERMTGGDRNAEMLALASFAMSVVLAALVGANFYLDWRRGYAPFASVSAATFAVDLRRRG